MDKVLQIASLRHKEKAPLSEGDFKTLNPYEANEAIRKYITHEVNKTDLRQK